MIFTRFSSWFLLWAAVGVLSISFDNVAHGLPQFLLTSGKPKCFKVEVPGKSTLKIHYEVPDIDTERKSKHYAPTYVTLMERPVETLEEQRLENIPTKLQLEKRMAQLKDMRRGRPKPVSQEITEEFGSFIHRTYGEDAVMDVCMRCSKASEKQPVLFHLRVEEWDEDVLDAFEQENVANIPLLGAEHHWSFLETQLDRIEHEMHMIIRESGFYRERDSLYHQQMDDLNKATVFWPILRSCIIVVTGITQANNIVSFFKKRRII